MSYARAVSLTCRVGADSRGVRFALAGLPDVLFGVKMAQDRGAGINLPSGSANIGLPPRVFLYTLDQLGVMLDLSARQIAAQYIYFEGRSIGSRHKWLMTARNIAPPDQPPEWRVAEREWVRWMRFKGFRYYERGAVSN